MTVPHIAPVRTAAASSGGNTRERILRAAMARFATQSYSTTSLRDLASDVGVDVAYVHRCFGSKENLFRASIRAAMRPDWMFAGNIQELAATLARQTLGDEPQNEVRMLDIVFRSFSSPDASQVLREVLMEDFIGPMIAAHPHVSKRQAALVAAFFAGVSILHDVIGSEPLLEGDDGETERLFVLALGQLLGNGPCATPSSPLWKGESSECSNISAEQGACQEPDAASEDQQKCRYSAGD
ncbi:AcrR family transcriptional regulator [Aquamicrobium lusatiense]|uniref:AcrR family transcriptional regulator n=1 Tax=Aquamicrobium lusatiense TaxID=89772 RepID=A0A7W9S6F1_9HYPH|nr:AcrR family transcriptional regulator [Aquamicrobium lusatiense]